MKAILFFPALLITLHTAAPENCQEKKTCTSITVSAKSAVSKGNLSGEGCIPGWMLNIFHNLGPQG
ncbi:hypothetical protein [Pedobacter sp. HMWF019]|uniref:hypothetical protein n=1 Tax=Pedobacter sp. HMWF019 TaxID=2056856 RepID=UPI0011B1F8C8|nr:hypothetical protein [Pedobacter sp. HMWF019]